jgi:two-component system, OmpR family, sensor histidine kinase MtrB
MSLRRASLVFVVAFACVGVGISGTLLVLTTNLHRAAHQIGGTVERLRIGEELEFGLVSLRHATDPLDREASENLLRREVMDASAQVSSTTEEQALDNVRQLVDAYIEIVERTPAAGWQDRRAAFEAAFAAAREWIRINIEQSRAIDPVVARWDRVANVVGISVMLGLLVGLGFLAWWIQRRTFRPALRLVGAIERYGQGDHGARATEQGPEEFRTIAHRFNDMASRLERQRAGQMAFLAGVAHDLRNPLTALKLATSLLPADQPLPPEPRVRQLCARISRQIDRLERMVYDFLDAARIEAGQLELHLENGDVRDIARATLDLFEPAARTHRLVTSFPDEPVRVRCDPMRIEQVLANLLSNAIKYSPNGGAVRLSIARRPDAVLIAVADQGIGMSPDDVEQVFEPFRRSSRADESIPGVGLGLFVARKLVDAHGGKILVETRKGVGSTFTVWLPVAGSEAPAG